MAEVKRANKRTQKALETRQRIVAAAHDLFVAKGYGATLLPEIAERAGVAVQTIYFTFGTKRKLLKEVVDVAVAGDLEPVATMDRPWFRDALDAPTAEELLRRLVAGATEVLGRVAPIIAVLDGAAAADPEVAETWSGGADPRYVVQQAAAETLVTKPGLRKGITADYAADLTFGLLSPELYSVLVGQRGWTREQWERWTHETLRHHLCAG